MPSLPGYIYAVRDERLYVNLTIGSQAQLQMSGSEVQITQAPQRDGPV